MTRHVLIVEDDLIMREALTEAMQQFDDVSVVKATNASDGFDKASKQRPDLILFAAGLPLMSGCALVERLQNHLELCTVPVVMLKASRQRLPKPLALASGTREFTTEPLVSAQLLALVEQALHAA